MSPAPTRTGSPVATGGGVANSAGRGDGTAGDGGRGRRRAAPAGDRRRRSRPARGRSARSPGRREEDQTWRGTQACRGSRCGRAIERVLHHPKRLGRGRRRRGRGASRRPRRPMAGVGRLARPRRPGGRCAGVDAGASADSPLESPDAEPQGALERGRRRPREQPVEVLAGIRDEVDVEAADPLLEDAPHRLAEVRHRPHQRQPRQSLRAGVTLVRGEQLAVLVAASARG